MASLWHVYVPTLYSGNHCCRFSVTNQATSSVCAISSSPVPRLFPIPFSGKNLDMMRLAHCVIQCNYRPTGILGRSNAEGKLRNIRQYCQTVAEVHGTWCTKNDARALFLVGARSVKMAVRKTSIFGEVYLFSDTVVCAFSEAAFGEISASIRCPKTSPICNIFS